MHEDEQSKQNKQQTALPFGHPLIPTHVPQSYQQAEVDIRPSRSAAPSPHPTTTEMSILPSVNSGALEGAPSQLQLNNRGEPATSVNAQVPVSLHFGSVQGTRDGHYRIQLLNAHFDGFPALLQDLDSLYALTQFQEKYF